MADATNEFLAEMLRRIQADSGDLKVDSREIRTRLGTVEPQVARLSVQYAEFSHRMDRRDELMERVKRRLELSEISQ